MLLVAALISALNNASFADASALSILIFSVGCIFLSSSAFAMILSSFSAVVPSSAVIFSSASLVSFPPAIGSAPLVQVQHDRAGNGRLEGTRLVPHLPGSDRDQLRQVRPLGDRPRLPSGVTHRVSGQ